MAKVKVDSSELRALSADLRAVPEQLKRHVLPVVEKGAVNIKNEMRTEAQKSKHFKQVARDISYDITQTSFGGDGVYKAEIGPTVGAGEAGNLGVIAYPGAPSGYFGGSRGGASLPDPQVALDHEAPKFEAALDALLGDLL